MKVLNIDGLFFKLPPEFEGGLSEALRLLADYHDLVKNAAQTRHPDEYKDLPKTEWRQKMWERFLAATKEGRLMCGCICISEDGENFDVNTGEKKVKV